MKSRIASALAAALLAGTAGAATDMEWVSVPMTQSGDSVATNGTLVYAYCQSNANGATNTVNTVPFAGIQDVSSTGDFAFGGDWSWYLNQGANTTPADLPPAAFREQMIFGTSDEPSENGLSIITCRRGRKSGLAEYTVAILNNTWEEKKFSIVAKAGRIAKVEELSMDRPERDVEEYLPYGIGKQAVGCDTATTIAGGSVRTFRVWLMQWV